MRSAQITAIRRCCSLREELKRRGRVGVGMPYRMLCCISGIRLSLSLHSAFPHGANLIPHPTPISPIHYTHTNMHTAGHENLFSHDRDPLSKVPSMRVLKAMGKLPGLAYCTHQAFIRWGPLLYWPVFNGLFPDQLNCVRQPA